MELTNLSKNQQEMLTKLMDYVSQMYGVEKVNQILNAADGDDIAFYYMLRGIMYVDPRTNNHN